MPVSIFEKSRISFISDKSVWLADWIFPAYSRISLSSLSRSIIVSIPRIALIGVRISCDILARNTLFAPSPAIAPSAANTAVRQPQVSVASGAAAPANTASAPSQSVGISSISKEERKIPVMKMSSLGVSIKNPQRDQAAQNTAKTNVAQVQTQPEEDFIFNDRDLNYYWQEYAGQLPKEQVAIAKRMQVIRPVLLNNSTTFEVVVDNEIAAKDFTALIPELQTYLRGRLKNSKVAMTVRVSEPAETVRAVGRVEKFQMMAQKNQALMQLKDEFGLELY